ncbi:MAG: TlpA family protein disulfide reductase [Acidimicrobiia bacterium]
MAESSSSNRTGIIIGAIGGAVVLLLIAAVVFGNEEVGTEYGEVEVQGEALPLMPQSAPIDESATGLAYPDVRGEDFDGDTVTIDHTDGRAKGIVFLAHWCSHCQAEVPRVQAWLDSTGGDSDVDLYSVATSMNSGQPNYPPSEWLEGENWTIPVIRDDQDNTVLINYGAGGFPYWVFTNSDGTVAIRTSGQLSTEQLETILATLS